MSTTVCYLALPAPLFLNAIVAMDIMMVSLYLRRQNSDLSSPACYLYQEETFGPVVGIQKVRRQ
jgi:hypothetical protein